MNEQPHRRSEDSPIRVWAPILAPVIAVAVAWGAMSTQLNGLSTTQQALVSDVRDLRDNRARAEVTLAGLQRELEASKVSVVTLSEIARDVGTLISSQHEDEERFLRVWPRLRAVEANITTVVRELERLNKDFVVKLEEPKEM